MGTRRNSVALLALSTAFFAAAWAAGTATAKPSFDIGSAPAGPVVASASGSGHTLSGVEQLHRTFSFTAREQSDGTDTGQAQLRSRGLQNTPIHMDLDCLRVTGNTATMTGVVTRIAEPLPPFFVVGSRVGFTVVDNGEGPTPPPDLISLVSFFGPIPPLNCNALFFPPTFPVEGGNVQVRS